MLASSEYHRNGVPIPLECAVADALTPCPYSHRGQIEVAEQRAQAASDMLGRLVEALAPSLGIEGVAHVLGHGWKVTLELGDVEE